MKKIKKVFLGIGALWSAMIAKSYATFELIISDNIAQGLYGPPQADLYGPPRIEEETIDPLKIIGIIAIIIGLNIILRKKFKEKKNILNIVLIISSVIVTVLAIIFIASMIN